MSEFLRAAWGAQPPKAAQPPIRNVPNGIVHHIGGGDPYPLSVVATLQQIQSMEQHGHYVDIAYNWGVDKDGNLWELRGDVKDGATLGQAGTSFSVLAICNGSAPNFIPTPALIAGIAACFRNAQARGVLASPAFVESHHYFDMRVTGSPTACCGLPLIGQIPTIQRLVAGPAPSPAPVPTSEDDVIKILSPTWKRGQKWRGVIVNLADRSFQQIGVHMEPNVPPQRMVPPNNNAWFDAQPSPGGLTLFTSDTDPYDYLVTDL